MNLIKNAYKFAKYLLTHKYYVLKHRKTFGVPFFQALAHDMSKFNPIDFFTYISYFYLTKEEKRAIIPLRKKYLRARTTHVYKKPHHWQYWATYEYDKLVLLEVPEKYVREMALDMVSAAISKNTGSHYRWYLKHHDKIRLHPKSKKLLEKLLRKRL